jgi:hypothetical protein
MNDLVVVLFIIGWGLAFLGLIQFCDMVRR